MKLFRDSPQNFNFSAFIFAFLISLLTFSSSATEEFKIDSLFQVFSESKIDTTRINTLNNLAFAFRANDPDTALYFATQAKLLAQKINYKIGVADGTLWQGLANYNLGQFDEALELLKKSIVLNDALLKISPPNLQGKRLINKTIAYANTGMIYFSKGNYPEALNNQYKALQLAEKIQYKKGIAIASSNIGFVYQQQGNLDAALTNFLSALKLMIAIGDKRGIANTYTNIGGVYHAEDKYEEALKNYLYSLKIKQEINDMQGMAATYNNLGNLYFEQDKYEEALKNLLACLKISEEIDNKTGITISCNNIGNIYFKLKKNKEAYFYYYKALAVAQEINSLDDIKQSYESLAAIDSVEHKFESALKNYKLFVTYRDSLFNEENTKKMVQSQMQFDFDKRETIAKAEQEKKDALAKKEIEAQKLVRNGLIAGFILALLIAIGIYRSLQQNRRAKQIITEQKTEVEAKNKEILSSIEYAKRLQNAILPTAKLVKEYIQDSFIFYRPKDIVAGDFYWFYPSKNSLNESIVLIAAADCTGHGVPGAMVSVVCANALNKAVKELNLSEPGKILDAVSNFVEETFVQKDSTHEDDVQDGMDISLCSLNLTTLRLQWSGANLPLLIVHEAGVEELKPDKQPIGLYLNRRPFTTRHHQLKRGTMLYLFSDGYADQFGGADGKKLLKKNLKQYFSNIASLPVEVQLTELAFHFENWKGNNSQVDDVCVIGLHI